MKRRLFFKKEGYSMIEMMVYISIMAFMTSVLISSIALSMRIYRTSVITRSFAEQGSLSMERITRAARGATSINTGASVFGTSPGILSLSSTTATPATTVFDVSSNQLRLTEDGTVTGSLTGGRLQLSSLIFRSVASTSVPVVKTELTLYDSISGRSETFYTTTILRNAY